jgi:hypothetical protein
MNGFAVIFCGFGLALAAAGAVSAAASPKTVAPAGPPPPAMQAALDAAKGPAPTPSFGSIPPLPKDVRSVKAWKTDVLTTKAEGAALTHEAAVEPWTLHDTEVWADEEKAQAVPPAPMTKASEEDTEAFAAALRARAMAPPRKR